MFCLSVQVLGQALKDLPRDKIVVATKVGRYGPEEFDFSAERVTRSVKESLHRLQIPYIDLIQTHDIEFGDLDQVQMPGHAAELHTSTPPFAKRILLLSSIQHSLAALHNAGFHRMG